MNLKQRGRKGGKGDGGTICQESFVFFYDRGGGGGGSKRVLSVRNRPGITAAYQVFLECRVHVEARVRQLAVDRRKRCSTCFERYTRDRR